MRKEHAILVLILASAFVLRLYGVLTDVFPFFREATYGMAAWRIVDGDLPYRDFYHSQPPLSPYLLASIFLIFGVGIAQARLFVVAFTTFTCFIIYLAGKRIDYKTGLLGSLVYAVAPWSVVYGMRVANDHLAMTFCVIGYYFLTPVITDFKKERNFTADRNNLMLAGLFVSVGVMIKTIVAPILLAFIAILIIEGQYAKIEINDQIKNVIFLIMGFIIPLLFVYSPFYLLIGDEFTKQVLGQHFSKLVIPWGERVVRSVNALAIENIYFFVFFALSAFFAIRRPYGRGLIICILVMVFTTFLLVPRAYDNYYLVLILWMSMICGFFPVLDLKSLASKKELVIVNFIIVLNLLFYKMYLYFNLTVSRATYFNHVSAKVALAATLVALIVFIVILIKEARFTDVGITDQVKNAFSLPYQILKRLKSIFDRDGIRFTIAVLFIVLIATTYVSYFPRSEKDKKAMDWVKANTSPDDYVLADDLKINFWTLRRSPYAEISRDRTRLGELTGEMFIQACYEYDVRVVVITGRLFGEFETYDVFIEFLENNYVPIIEGYIIYVRTASLQ